MPDAQTTTAPGGVVPEGTAVGRPVSASAASIVAAVSGGALVRPAQGGALVPPSAANPVAMPNGRTGGSGKVPGGKFFGDATGPVPGNATANGALPVSPIASPQNFPPGTLPEPPVRPAASPSAAPASEEPPDFELPGLRPEAVAFMTSQRYRDSENGLIRDFGLTPDDLSFLNEMDHLVLGSALPVAGYIRGLRGEFPGLPQDRKEQLIGRLVAERLMPWGDALKPSAEVSARTEKLALPNVPYYAVYLKPLTYGGAAGEVARMADVPLGGKTRERLRDLLMSRVKGVRLDAQVEEQLMRSPDLGGMGLQPEQARAVTIAMNELASRAKLVTEEEYSAWLTEESKAKTQAAAAKAAPAARRAEDDEDEKEIAAMREKMPKPVRDTSSVLALSTETILGRLSAKPTDEYLQRRLRDIVSTRLRDVRTKNEALLRLMREAKVGGLGLERKQAEQVANEIEEGYKEFHGLIADEEKGKLETQTQEQAVKVAERKKREAEEHARWFEEKVRGKRLEDESTQQMVQRMKTFAQGYTNPVVPAHPVDVKDKVREEAAFGELVEAKASGMSPAASRVPSEAKPEAPAPIAPPAVRPMVMSSVPDIVLTKPAPVGPAPSASVPTPASPALAINIPVAPAKEQVPTPAPVSVPAAPPAPAPSATMEKPANPKLVFATFSRPAAFPSAPAASASTPPPPRSYAPPVKVSAETAKMAAAEAGTVRPRMDDVKIPRTHLAGPLQELEDLTLAAFRRLGKTPEEAVARIKRNLDLLAQESFERKIEGIQAWQGSPLQKAYLTLVAEAFSTATPVNTLVEQKRAAGEETLTSTELSAIVDLNGSLQM